MVHYIRDEKNNTLLDLEVYTLEDGTPDIGSSVDIINYTDFILKQDSNKQQTAKFIFDKLSEIRGWYWEIFRVTKNTNPSKEEVDRVIGDMVRAGAEVLGLKYITD